MNTLLTHVIQRDGAAIQIADGGTRTPPESPCSNQTAAC
jgi:hypothetical protein